MGVMRFLVQPTDVLADWPEAHRAYLCALDASVWPTRVELQGNQLLLRRQVSDSARLHVAWPVAGFGRPVLSTASLPERSEPYLLPVELARGKIVQVRNQVAAWQSAGMAISREFHAVHREAQHLFAKAAAAQDTPSDAARFAQQALIQALEAAELLTRTYTKQRLDNRHRHYPQLPTALVCGLGDGIPDPSWLPDFTQAFNTATVPLQWRHIEPEEGNYRWNVYDTQVDWCLKHNLLMRAGPLLDFSANGLPHWLWEWEHDYWNLESFVCDFVETAIARYVGRIRIWEVSARVNTGGALTLTEEQRLTLVAKTLEVAHHADPEGQFLVRIDQPWGEYQARGQHRLSPMQFADALVRASLGLSGINLEISVGYSPSGSLSRDLFDFSRLLDQWSSLGLPLQVTLAFPSAKGPDLHLDSELEVASDSWRQPWSEQAQADWIDAYMLLLMAKPAVVAISFTHFTDAHLHRFPHAGLLDADQHPKLALQRIMRHRKAYWK